jgi:uncharacterized protein
MNTTSWHALARFIGRWRIAIVVAVLVLAGLAVPGLMRLEFDTRQDTLVSADSQLFKDNVRYQAEFGGGELVVLFTGDPLALLQGENLKRLEAVERELAKSDRFVRTVSPLTILKAAELEVAKGTEQGQADALAAQARASKDAREKALAEGKTAEEAAGLGQAAAFRALAEFIKNATAANPEFKDVGALNRSNPKFVKAVLYGATASPRPEVTGVIPDAGHALLITNIRGNMSVNEQDAAAAEMSRIIAAAGFESVTTSITGETVLLKSIADSLEKSIPQLAIVALILMVVVVLTVFRARWRLLHLPVVFLALIIAFGLIGFLDLPLTLASTAGLPILLGLAVDFGIQFHSRYEEEFEALREPLPSMRRALRQIGPALLVAMVAACLGFAALRYSTVPMIQDFSIVLGAGLVVVFVICLFLLNGLLFHRDRRATGGQPAPMAPARIDRLLARVNRATISRPLPILAVALALAAAGFAVENRIEAHTEPEQFIPAGSQVLEDLAVVEDVTGTSNSLSFLITAKDVSAPAVVAWMAQLAQERQAADPRIIGVESLASLLQQAAQGGQPDNSAAAIDAAVKGTPADIRAGFISEDRTKASITFLIQKDVKLIDQKPIIDAISASAPPDGVDIAPAGLGVLGVEAETGLTGRRTEMTAIAILASLVLLLLVTRSLAHTVLTLVPVVLVTGWTSAAMFAFGIPLNPLTAIAAPLVVALGTEFSVLLMLRYREERARGLDPASAMAFAYERSGRAIVASALTVTGAFVALAFNGFPLLSDFGIVAVIGVVASLLGAMLLMPPLLVWVDQRSTGKAAILPDPA